MKRITLILLTTLYIFTLKAQNVIFNEGFETATTTLYTSSNSGLAGLTGWSYSKTHYGRLRFMAGAGFYHTGSHAATLDDNYSSSTNGSWNQLIKTVDLTNYVSTRDMVLSFYYMDHGDETDLTYDVVSIRASDTSTWYTVYHLDPSSKSNGNWVFASFDFDSAMSANSIVPTSTFQIRFGQYDEEESTSTTGNDGITFDDIELIGTAFKGLNVSLVSIDTPTSWKVGSSRLAVSFQNLGKDTIRYVSFGYQINSGAAVKIDSIPVGNMVSGQIKSYSFKNSMILKSGVNDVKVWANKPNGALPDSNNTDDTLHQIVYPYLVDTFYIDSAGNGDFLSFNAAIDVLKQAGVCGHTCFIVKNGVYSERIEIPEIKGAGPKATITFIGESKKSTILTHNGLVTATRSTVFLNGADYIRFKNMTIQNTGPLIGAGLIFTNNADNNLIDNCIVEVFKAGYSLLTGILASYNGSLGVYGGYHNTISNNIIRGGNSGIKWEGKSASTYYDVKIINNEFVDQFFYGVRIEDSRGTKIIGNKIEDTDRGVLIGVSLFFTDLDTVIGNIIHPGSLGIGTDHHNTNLDSNSSYRSLFANNMISNFKDTINNAGIGLVKYSYLVDIYHNTIWVNGSNVAHSGNVGICLRQSGFCNIKNNIVVATNNSYALTLYYPETSQIDYNDYYYSRSTSFARFYWNFDYLNLTGFKSKNGHFIHDLNSYDDINPNLLSNEDLHLDLKKVHNLFGTKVNINEDIDGDPRCINVPYLGADDVLHMTVFGLSDTVLNFGTTFQNFSFKDTLLIYNGKCSDTLIISNITTSDTAFKVDKTSGSIYPANMFPVIVTFNSSSIKKFNDTITIYSNYDTVHVLLKTDNRGKPKLVIDPYSVSQTISGCDDSTTVQVVLKNLGNGRLDVELVGSDKDKKMAEWLETRSFVDTISVNDSLLVDLKLKSKGLLEKKYSTYVHVYSTDPHNPHDSIKVELEVVSGTPIISVQKTIMNFDSIAESYFKTLPLEIENIGCTELVINSISTQTRTFTASNTKLTIPAYSNKTITVTFSDTAIQSFTDTLKLITNGGNTDVVLIGKTFAAPEMQTDVSQMNYKMTKCKDSVEVFFKIYNKGSLDLTYTVTENKEYNPVGFSDNFSSNTFSSLWSNTSGVANLDNCGYRTGPYAVYFNGSGIRALATYNLNASNLDSITFFLKAASGGTSPCETPGSSNIMYLQYSTDGGTYWNTLGTYVPSNFYKMTRVSAPLPASAKTSQTTFRWSQPAHLSTSDNWLLDNVLIISKGGWLSNTGSSGTIKPGDSVIIKAKFNSINLQEGVYRFPIALTSNDPRGEKDTVWARFNYKGNPQLKVNKSKLEFGKLLNYSFKTDSFLIENTGCGMLDITNLSTHSYTYTIWPDKLSLFPGESRYVYIDFFPPYSGIYDDTIKFSGDIDTFIPVFAQGIGPQVLDVPTQNVTNSIVSCNDSVNVQVLVANKGDADLIIELSDSAAGTGNSFFIDNFESKMNPYLWQYSSGEISNVCGTHGGTGAMYFNNSSTRYIQTKSIDATNLKSILFYLKYGKLSTGCEMLDAGKEVQLMYSTDNGSTWTIIQTYSSTLYDKYTYINEIVPVAAKTKNTIFKWQQKTHSGNGFDNWVMDGVIFNGKKQLSYSWMSFPVRYDTLGSHDSTLYDVWLHGLGLTTGTYIGYINVKSNDPNNPIATVPCTLIINSKPQIVTSTNSIWFDTIVQRKTVMQKLSVSNSGCENLYISKIYSNGTDFSTNTTTLTVEAGCTKNIEIYFTPSTTGYFSDTIYLKNNDKLQKIFVEGYGVEGAHIQTTYQNTRKILSNCYNQATIPIEIENTGKFDLYYFIDQSVLPFWIEVSNYADTLSPGSKHQIQIQYNTKGLGIGEHTYALLINSNDDTSPIDTIICEVKVEAMLGGYFNLGSDTTICSNNPLILSPGSKYINFSWNNGTTGETLVAKKTGTYWVIVIDSNGCKFSDTINIIGNAGPKVQFFVNDTDQCFKNHEFIFKNLSTIQTGNIASWKWIVNGTKEYVNTDSFNYSFNKADKYNVKLIVESDQGCIDSSSQNLYVRPEPVVDLGKDTILNSSDSLILDAGPQFSSYKWSIGTNEQTVKIDSNLLGLGTHKISVLVENEFGCTASDTVNVGIAYISSIKGEYYGSTLKIYPNPTHTFFIVEVDRKEVKPINLSIYNMSGQLIFSKFLESSQKHFKEEIGVRNIAKGIYYIKVTSGNNSTYQKLMIN